MAILESLFGLEGKVALVTGASGGIGSAIAKAYAEAGATVVLNGTRREKLEALAEEIGLPEKTVIMPADLSTPEACKGLIAQIESELGRLDILVNNAGINRRKPFEDFTEEDYRTILSVNLDGVFFLSQAVHPLMKKNGGGKIIQIGSMTSYVGIGNVGVYGMTKSAIGQLAKTLAVEWAKDNIQVNCLCPGFIVTPLTEAGMFSDEKKVKWILGRVPAHRPGTPEDLLGVALLLASPASSYLTGQLIAIDGGFLAGGSWDNPF
ncbi:MAG: glucose 1-dehydrogenase [Armatimonadetes bacterium]|nr:glucose 1-dehydrogenase [Armatimonadota bacterium]